MNKKENTKNTQEKRVSHKSSGKKPNRRSKNKSASQSASKNSNSQRPGKKTGEKPGKKPRKTFEKKPRKFLSEMLGVLRVHPDGYGFFIPDDTTVADAFVPPRRLNAAMHGDRVQVKVYQDSRNRLEAEVIKIVERGNTEIVGEFFIKNQQGYVRGRVHGPKMLINIPKRSQKNAREGELVVVTVTDFTKLQGRVVKILGAKSTALAELESIYEKYHLTDKFPKLVKAESNQIAKSGIGDLSGRKDLRKKNFVTIDGETAKDFDDAICVEKNDSGFKLYVSIADVSHYVRVGTELDKNAYQRGTSAYFPHHCIPMLPEVLSNGLCSLVPYEDRLTFTAEIQLDAKGEVVHSKIYKSVIQSKARLTYNWVNNAIIEKDKELAKEHPKVGSMLRLAVRLAKKLRKNRFDRGTIDFDLPDKVFVFDKLNFPTNILRAQRNFAHMMIEEFMILANEVVADFSIRKKIPFLYRIHETPDEDKVNALKVLLHNLGYRKKMPADSEPKDFAKVTEWAAGRPEEKMINHILLRTMKQAVYSPENRGHFGLASQRYSHFTSPIRRYPDLIIHRILGEYLETKGKKKELSFSEQALAGVATHCSQQERNAMEAEWEVQDLKIAQFMQDKVGLNYPGHVARVTRFGLYVELQEFFVSGLVHVEDIEDDYYEFDPANYRLIGKRHKQQFRIGQALNIQVSSVSLEEREVRFILTLDTDS